MSSFSLFKSSAGALLLSLLAACGGNDAAPGAAAEERNVGFASAAMVVPAGQASKSIGLTGCSAFLRSNNQSSVAISITPTWVIFANGDLVVTAGLGTATSATEFVRVNDATAVEKDVWGSLSGSSTDLNLYYENADGTEIYGEVETSGLETETLLRAKSSTHQIDCSLAAGTSAFTLTVLPSSARVASTYLSGVTGTTVDTSELAGATYTFVNSVISWDSGGTSTYADRFLSFNVVTGELKTGTSMASITRTIALSTVVTPSTNVYYEEWIQDDGNREVYFELSTNVDIYMNKVGNALTFRPTNINNNS